MTNTTRIYGQRTYTVSEHFIREALEDEGKLRSDVCRETFSNSDRESFKLFYHATCLRDVLTGEYIDFVLECDSLFDSPSTIMENFYRHQDELTFSEIREKYVENHEDEPEEYQGTERQRDLIKECLDNELMGKIWKYSNIYDVAIERSL